jgi:hypothetical protein
MKYPAATNILAADTLRKSSDKNLVRHHFQQSTINNQQSTDQRIAAPDTPLSLYNYHSKTL